MGHLKGKLIFLSDHCDDVVWRRPLVQRSSLLRGFAIPRANFIFFFLWVFFTFFFWEEIFFFWEGRN